MLELRSEKEFVVSQLLAVKHCYRWRCPDLSKLYFMDSSARSEIVLPMVKKMDSF